MKEKTLVAMLVVKDEELYIRYCIENLIYQGFDIYLINNESSDDTLKIAKQYLNKGVMTIESFKTDGVLDLMKFLRRKEEIANSLDVDWFMHTDADEIRLPHPPFKTIKEALKKVESLGYSAVNFDVFNFMPEKGQNYADKNYEKEMKYYYYYSSRPFSQVKLWKKTESPISFGVSGGHNVNFDGIRIYPNSFLLKHYMFLSEKHGIEKYSKKRKYSEYAVKNYGWHGFRATFKEENFYLPPKSKLKKLGSDGVLDTSDPTPVHLFYRIEDKSEENHLPEVSEQDKDSKPSEEKVVGDGHLSIKSYRLFLSLYRRIIPFKLRQKIKNILVNTSNY